MAVVFYQCSCRTSRLISVIFLYTRWLSQEIRIENADRWARRKLQRGPFDRPQLECGLGKTGGERMSQTCLWKNSGDVSHL